MTLCWGMDELKWITIGEIKFKRIQFGFLEFKKNWWQKL
jgi:hypothetical protein